MASSAAALFEVWFDRHLRPAVSEALLGSEVGNRIGPADTRVVVRALTRPGELLTTDERDTLVRSTLIAAWSDVAGRLGWEPDDWRWGDLHRSRFEHPLANRAEALAPELAARLRLPPRPMAVPVKPPTTRATGPSTSPCAGALLPHGARCRRVGRRAHDEQPGAIG